MRAIFRGAHSSITDLEHIRIVPVSWTGVRFEAVLQVEDLKEAYGIFFLAVPAIGDVARGTPQISYVLGPQPRLAGAPLAKTENDRPAAGRQPIMHGGIGGLRVFLAGFAPIVFQVVHAPGGV